MKKPTVKFTKSQSNTARVKLAFEIQFDQRDPEAAEKAWATIGKVMAEILPTAEKRQEFLDAMQAAIKEAQR